MRTTLSVVLLLLGILLPPAQVTSALTGAALPQVVMGIWALKLTLVLIAAFVTVAGRSDLRASGVVLRLETDGVGLNGAGWWLGLVLFLAALLRFHRLGEGLWFDEIQTLVEYVRLPLGRILTTYDSQNQHLLYSASARAAVVLLGETPTALRLPAALFGVASLWAAYRLGRELAGAREGILVTTLLAMSYHHVWFSQNARGYTGLMLWTLIGTLAFLELLRDPEAGWGWIATYGLAMALGAYTHITSAFTSLAHLLVLGVLAWREPSRGTRPWLRPAYGIAASALLGLALYAPVLPQFAATLLAPSPHAAETEWQNPLWLATEMLRGLARGVPGGWIAIAAGVAVAAAGVRRLWTAHWTLPTLLILPGLLTAVAMVALGHNLWPRFFFFSAGFAAIIAVRGTFALAERVRTRWAMPAATTLLLLLAAGSLWTVPRAWGPKQDFESAWAHVAAHRAPGDAVVTVDLTTFPYERYVPCECIPVQSAGELASIEATHPRTWLMYTFPIRLRAVQPAIWKQLEAAYDTSAVFPGTVSGGAVVVMVTRAPSPAS